MYLATVAWEIASSAVVVVVFVAVVVVMFAFAVVRSGPSHSVDDNCLSICSGPWPSGRSTSAENIDARQRLTHFPEASASDSTLSNISVPR